MDFVEGRPEKRRKGNAVSTVCKQVQREHSIKCTGLYQNNAVVGLFSQTFGLAFSSSTPHEKNNPVALGVPGNQSYH